MRMKWNKSGQLLLVAMASLTSATLIAACGQISASLTADFVFVTSARAAGPNSYGEVDVFEINSQSGHMRQIPSSPFPSGGRNPVAEAVASDNSNLYVVNRDDNTIVRFVIGSDGKLYPYQTVNTPGIFPMAVTVAGSTLFVADTYQPLPACSSASPCSGSIAAFPIDSTSTDSTAKNSLVTRVPVNSCNGSEYLPLALTGTAATHIIQPMAIHGSAKNNTLFVAAKDTTANAGYLFGYTVSSLACKSPADPTKTVNISVLTPLAGSPWAAGHTPSSVAQDGSGNLVYVTDFDGQSVLGFAVNGGNVTSIGTFGAGNQPASIAISGSGKYAFVANSLDSTVTVYSVSNGQLTRVESQATDTQPVAVGVDPKLDQYLFTANFLASTVSGYQINANSGALVNSQFSPFKGNADLTAVAAVPHK